MKIISTIIVYILLSLLFGCGHSDTTIIIETKVEHVMLEDCLNHVLAIKVSDIADSIFYIELKTPRDMPIGVVSYIKTSEEYIFIVTGGVVYQFSLNGDYIRRIGGRGKGPGEYLVAFDFFIDEHQKILSVLDYNELYSYSFDGKFMKRSIVGMLSGVFVKDSLIYASNETTGREKYKMVVLNTHLDTIAGIPNDNIFDIGYTIGSASPFRQPFYEYDDDVYFKGYQDNDTIWHIDSMKYETHVVIGMGKYKYPEWRNTKDVDTWMSNLTQKKGDYYRVNYAMEDNHFIYLTLEPYFNPEMGSPRVLFDKTANKGMTARTASGEDGLIDDILGGPTFWPKNISGNDYVSVVNAEDLIEKSRDLPSPSASYKKFLLSINEDSNPVVIIATKRK